MAFYEGYEADWCDNCSDNSYWDEWGRYEGGYYEDEEEYPRGNAATAGFTGVYPF